jgi:hypothetical protein
MLTGGSGRNLTLGVIEDLRRNIHPEAKDPDSSTDSWQLGDARHLSRQRINQRELGLRHVLRQARARSGGQVVFATTLRRIFFASERE